MEKNEQGTEKTTREKTKTNKHKPWAQTPENWTLVQIKDGKSGKH